MSLSISKNQNQILVATLGSEPQVIALAIQLLEGQGILLQQVVVLHTDPTYAPVDSALPALIRTFDAQPTWPLLKTVIIPAVDVLTPAQHSCFSESLFQVLRQASADGRRIHLLLAGGRKPMAMIGTTIAQMLLGPEDKLWYLHSDEPLRKSRRFLLKPDDSAQLVAIDLPALSPSPPRYTPTIQAHSALDAHVSLRQIQKAHRQRFVDAILTPAERDVAALVAHEVMTVQQIADALYKSPKTVSNQLNSIYSKLESEFGLQPDKGVKREFLRQVLGEVLVLRTETQ